MLLYLILSLITFSTKCHGYGYDDDDVLYYDTFPDDFQWGFATASYQIEGAWDVDGKGQNIWDEYSHRIPSKIDDGSNGDVACDSYNKYEEDVRLLKEAGAQTYRLSLSWSRIFPTGKNNVINDKGIEYYDNVINLLIMNGIEPMITLYHWDLPLPLQEEYGGWPNEALVQHFVNFADLAFERFGDRVKQWITFNEPWVFCYQGYWSDGKAPGVVNSTDLPYNCSHTVIKAHAATYHLYQDTYKSTQNGKVGITLDCSWAEPEDGTNPNHVAAADRALRFKLGWYWEPITTGKYPEVMEPFTPRFTEEESNQIKGTSDFLGINHYTSQLVVPANIPGGGWDNDQRNERFMHDSWPESSAEWLRVVPWGFRKLLNWIKDTYDNPEIYITENGFADYPDTGVEDTERCNYYRDYINQMLKAVKRDNVRVTKYTAWSLLDNFEWKRGYTQRFGVHYIDFNDTALTRTPKASVAVLKKIFTDNGFKSNATKNTISYTILALVGLLYYSMFV